MPSDPKSTSNPSSASASRGATPGVLAARTEEILRRGPRTVTTAQVEFDREVVRQSRLLMGLLARRRRSEGELRARLREREVQREVADEAMARIARAGLIDDQAFAIEWVAQRRRLRSLSDEALRRELESRDVAHEHIVTALALDDSDEEERARELVRSKLAREDRRLSGPSSREAERKVARRLDALLRRKGYDGALALRVISTELRAATGR